MMTTRLWSIPCRRGLNTTAISLFFLPVCTPIIVAFRVRQIIDDVDHVVPLLIFCSEFLLVNVFNFSTNTKNLIMKAL